MTLLTPDHLIAQPGEVLLSPRLPVERQPVPTSASSLSNTVSMASAQ